MRAMDLDQARLPERIGDYKLLRRIGRGGMGEVWLASKPGLAKPCALKIVLPEHARNPEYRRRFLREAKILSTLRHGRIVTVIEVGEATGYLFIAMDYIDGVNLRTLCETLAAQGRRLPITVTSYIIGEIFEALRHAHTRTIGGVLHGVIHRDVTPDNVMISSEGEVFLSDFGIARFGADGSAEMFGKLQYMAPEQGLGTASYRSDIWSACGVLHYMLTGDPPRPVLTWQEFLANMHPPVRPTGRSDVPEPLERLRLGGLEPDANQRLASAKDALLLLESWLGYRKATTMLAEIYGHVIGPARSGMTDMVPVAVVQQWAPSPPRPAAPDQRRVNVAATVVISPAPPAPPEGVAANDELDDEPGTWRRRWWKGKEDDEREPDPEEQLTTRFVEADAPRLFRRKRVVTTSDEDAAELAGSKLASTVELPPVTAAAEHAASRTTPPLDPALLASLVGGATPAAEVVQQGPADASERSTDRHAAASSSRGEAVASSTATGCSTSGPAVKPPRGEMRTRTKMEPGRIFFIVGFTVVVVALVAGLAVSCESLGLLGRASEPAAEGR